VKLSGPARRLSIFIGESDQYRHHPLYHEIVARARDAGLAGASVFRGIEGYGATSRIHTTRILSLSEDLPLVVVIVDTAAKIEAFLPQLDELIGEGLVILDDVEVIKYVGRGVKPGREGEDDPGSAGHAGSAGHPGDHDQPPHRHHRWGHS
jgi:PII-like signaling protein